jgi:hypothetical protein
MDPLSSACGVAALARSNRPLTLEQWNARYDAMNLELDWLFKAGSALARRIHSGIVWAAEFPLFGAQRRPRLTR